MQNETRQQGALTKSWPTAQKCVAARLAGKVLAELQDTGQAHRLIAWLDTIGGFSGRPVPRA